MAIPDYETLMPPTLQFAADENEHSFRETIDFLAQKFNLTEEEKWTATQWKNVNSK